MRKKKPPAPTGAALLTKAIAARGLTQGDIERKLGVADGLVCRWCSGARVPNLRNALALEALVGVPATAWFARRAA